MAKKESKDEVAQRGGHTFIADFSICADCHDNMEARLKGYRAEIEGKMQAAKAMLDRATDSDSEAYKAAKWNYDMVKGDSGYGLHNIPYARGREGCWYRWGVTIRYKSTDEFRVLWVLSALVCVKFGRDFLPKPMSDTFAF